MSESAGQALFAEVFGAITGGLALAIVIVCIVTFVAAWLAQRAGGEL